MYPLYAFFSCLVFAFIHLYGEQAKKIDKITHGKFLSLGGGVAISYVFIDLLPKLCKNDQIVSKAYHHLFPFLEKHVYVMALLGFLLFFLMDRVPLLLEKKASFWFSLFSYALFNFFVGYAVVDKNDPEVQPLALFTFAMALHYFINDFSLRKEHGKEYNAFAKWVLVLALFLGWTMGFFFVLSAPAVGLISAFIGGGVIMNVIRHELRKENLTSLSYFLGAAFAYTVLLLFIASFK